MKMQKWFKQGLFVTTLTLSTAALAAPTQAADQPLSPNQVKQVEQVVQNYLLSHPQILIQMSESLQKQAVADAQKHVQDVVAKNAKEIFNNPNTPVAGNLKGNVTLVEFFDYQCIHCKEMAPIVKQLLQSDKNLRVVFKELPIFGGSSVYAAEAALAAQKQGKFLAFHTALMAQKSGLTKTKILAVAKSVGINVKQLEKDMQSQAIADQIKQNFELMQALQLQGTPAFIIANRSSRALDQVAFIPGATTKDNLVDMIQKVANFPNKSLTQSEDQDAQ